MYCRAIKLTLCTLLLATTSRADTLLLQNGDRITGVVESIAQGVVTIQTDYAGALEVQQEAVAGIETESPRAVRLESGALVEGPLEMREGNTGVLQGGTWLPAPPPEMVGLARPGEAPPELAAPEDEEPKRWSGSVDLGFTHRTGHTDTTDFNLGSTATREGERNTLRLTFTAAYGEADDILNTRRFAGEAKWQYYLKPRLYWYLLGAAERDDGRKLDLRAVGGSGIGYDIIDQERRTLSADAGLTYTHEEWAPYTPWGRDKAKADKRSSAFDRLNQLVLDIGNGAVPLTLDSLERALTIAADFRDPLRDAETVTEQYVNLRIGAEYTEKLFKASTLSEKLVLLPNLDDLGEFRATSELEFLTPISETLSLRCALQTEYDSLAEDSGVDAWSNTFLTSVRYEF